MITLEQWQNGDFRKFPEFSTQEGYYKAVRELIAKYGKPTKKDMFLVRSGVGEHKTRNYGASWTTNANVCRRNAKRYLVENIYVIFVPKGTMAVHLPEKGLFEEEYVLDMEGKADSVLMYAEHRGEFDWRSDFETPVDFENWHLVGDTIRIMCFYDRKLAYKLVEAA